MKLSIKLVFSLLRFTMINKKIGNRYEKTDANIRIWTDDQGHLESTYYFFNILDMKIRSFASSQ